MVIAKAVHVDGEVQKVGDEARWRLFGWSKCEAPGLGPI